MKNRKGFTLIELMIVVAVTSILVQCFWAPGQTLLGIDKRTRARIDENYQLVKTFNRLKTFSMARSLIKSEAAHELGFSDDAKIIIDVDRKKIVLVEPDKQTDLEVPGLELPLKKINERTFMITMRVNGEKMNTCWRCGK
jgi:prepilin-type N-terminal cleavage/methylation domain-containing protein